MPHRPRPPIPMPCCPRRCCLASGSPSRRVGIRVQARRQNHIRNHGRHQAGGLRGNVQHLRQPSAVGGPGRCFLEGFFPKGLCVCFFFRFGLGAGRWFLMQRFRCVVVVAAAVVVCSFCPLYAFSLTCELFCHCARFCLLCACFCSFCAFLFTAVCGFY